MTLIINPTPITAPAFNHMWIMMLQVMFPFEAQTGFIQGQFLPYNGTHLLASGGVSLQVLNLASKRTADANLNSMLINLQTEIARQSKISTTIKFINIYAPDPAKPVSATILFMDRNSYKISDCYALAETDPIFAGVLNSTLTEAADLAGLTVS